MALLGFDSFDVQSPNESGNFRWTISTCGLDTSIKRTGRASADISGGSLATTYGLSGHPVTFGIAHAHRITALGVRILSIEDGSSPHLAIVVNSSGAIEVRRGNGGGTLLGTSANSLIATNTWFHIEVKATIDNTTGAVEVRLNGVSVLTLTSQDTANTANVYVASFGLEQGKVDDVLWWDTSTGANNDFHGDCSVEGKLVDAAGDSTDLTPSAGSNFQNVDDVPADEDTTYNESSTVNHKDLYNVAALNTTSGSVKGVQVLARMRKTDAGTRTASVVSKSGTTETVETAVGLTESYVTYLSPIMAVNPDTGVAWTISNVNALQVGVKVIS